ncbi:YeiH family putative sulfate export transporter [Chitinibacter bivalviorum]|uniref:YeiH family putative sulfate export transporter n=1 Tax=Chitinibacter bivalviorum TaxID=2739434 RepID=A0A7H9BJC8_9NEIS|nr:YeiH family protein [Chitinibacter bivalviorum]QLG88482.1 YeiH family putative sulfate export transporter [Chitinibacter bivalviorum]
MNSSSLNRLIPGLILVGGITAVAQFIGDQLPLMGGAVAGILLGLLIRSRFSVSERQLPGVQFAGKQLLQWSIVGLGLALPISAVLDTGLKSLSVTLVTLSIAFVSAFAFGKLLKIPTKLCVLIGGGTAICGGSAIAAMTPVIKPDDHETAFSLSTIFLFNIVAVLLFPPLGQWLGMSDTGFGLWAGTAINDTSSVVAAAYSWSKEAGDHATIVKLSRAMLIIPVTLILSFVFMKRNAATQDGQVQRASIRHAVPWFIVWFVAASLFNGYLPEILTSTAHSLSTVMITAALTAIGLSTDLGKMKHTGWRPVALGLIVWIMVAGSSLVMQHLGGHW